MSARLRLSLPALLAITLAAVISQTPAAAAPADRPLHPARSALATSRDFGSFRAVSQSVVVLRFWLDMTEAQVAQALGCSVGTVKSQGSRALAKLRACAGLGEGVGREQL